MATQKFIPPQLAPDLLARQLRMQQHAQDAQRLIEQGSQMPQGQMVSGHFVAPSWTQQLASALSGPVGRAIQDKLPDQMAGIQRDQSNAMMAQFGFGGQPSPQQLADGLNGGAQSMPVDMGGGAPQGGGQGMPMAQPGGMAPPQQPQPAMPMGMQPGGGQFQAPGSGQGPMLLPGMNAEQSRMALMNLGPAEYLKLYQKQFEPTTEQRNLSHLSPEQRNRLIEAQFLNEAGKDGTRMIMGQDGQMYAVPVQGYAETQAALTGATERAKAGAQAQYDLVAVPDGQGGTRMMPRSQAVGALGGAGGGASAGFGETLPEAVVAARAELPKVVEQATQMIASIDGMLNHPGLPGAVGFQTGAAYIPGTQERDFVARSDQLQGQAFLQAFESLKGGGQITEVEGQAATNAIARLSRAQSEEAYKEGLTELKGILTKAIARAQEKARMPSQKQSGGIPAISSPEQLQSMPSGSVFRAPDGSLRRVP